MIYVLLADGFEEIEAIAPVDFLRRCGVEVTTVSIGDREVCGAHGLKLFADVCAREIDFSDAKMIVLPGGMPGTTHLDAWPQMDRVLSDCFSKGGSLAAICAAPIILGKRGYLSGKSAICYPGFEEYLTDADATLSEKKVVRDGRIITAMAAGVAWDFGYALARMFASADVCDRVWNGLFLGPRCEE